MVPRVRYPSRQGDETRPFLRIPHHSLSTKAFVQRDFGCCALSGTKPVEVVVCAVVSVSALDYPQYHRGTLRPRRHWKPSKASVLAPVVLRSTKVVAEPEPEPSNLLLVVRQVVMTNRGGSSAEFRPAVAAEMDTAKARTSLLRKGNEPLEYPQ